MASSLLGGDDKQGALYLTDYDTFATAEKKSPREAVLTVVPACVLSQLTTVVFDFTILLNPD